MHTGSPAHRRDFLGQFDHMKGHHSRCESRRGQSGLAIPRTERSGTTSWSVEVRGRPYPHTAEYGFMAANFRKQVHAIRKNFCL